MDVLGVQLQASLLEGACQLVDLDGTVVVLVDGLEEAVDFVDLLGVSSLVGQEDLDQGD